MARDRALVVAWLEAWRIDPPVATSEDSCVLYLLISIVALFAGILAMPLARERPTLLALLDGFVLVAIGGLVLFHILPHTIEVAHGWAVSAGVVGLFVPLLLERGAGHRGEHGGGNGGAASHDGAQNRLHKSPPANTHHDAHHEARHDALHEAHHDAHHDAHHEAHHDAHPDAHHDAHHETNHHPGLVVGSFAILGLGLHAFMDGIALALPGDEGIGHEGAGLLVVAVLIHRFPAGLGLSWAMLPQFGLARTLGAGLSVAIATVCGFIFSGVVVDMAQRPELAIFQAFVAGSLLHVVFAHAPRRHDALMERKTSALGALLGIALLFALGGDHSAGHHVHGAANTGDFLLALALKLAPFLLLSMVGAGLIYALFGPGSRPRAVAERWRPGAFLMRLPTPPCSCGLTFQHRTWVRSGMPAAVAVAFLVAVPEMGLDTVMMSLPVLGPAWTALRLMIGILMALALALLASRLFAPVGEPQREGGHSTHEHEQPHGDTSRPHDGSVPPTSFVTRLRAGLHYGLVDLCDHLMPWIFFGFGLAALVEPLIDPEAVARSPEALQVVLLVFAGIPLRVCGSASIPLAAVFLEKGFSIGAVMAFLWAGLTTYAAAGGLMADPRANAALGAPRPGPHPYRASLLFGTFILLTACGAGMSIDLAAPSLSGLGLQKSAPGPISLLHVACLALVGCLWLNTFFRCGPRALLAQVVPAYVTPDGYALHDHCRHRQLSKIPAAQPGKRERQDDAPASRGRRDRGALTPRA